MKFIFITLLLDSVVTFIRQYKLLYKFLYKFLYKKTPRSREQSERRLNYINFTFINNKNEYFMIFLKFVSLWNIYQKILILDMPVSIQN
jgi:hypothetical protein